MDVLWNAESEVKMLIALEDLCERTVGLLK
ncbi:hypothetical protein NPIL_46001, partial [Nephila pilipes]